MEDAFGRIDLLECTVVHDGDAVGDRQRLLLVVRDRNCGDACLLDDSANLLAHLDAEIDVEVGKRFVEQQHLGFGCERSGERDPLLLPARELFGIMFPVALETDQLEQFLDACVALLVSPLLQAESDVLACGEMGKSANSWKTTPTPRSSGGTNRPSPATALSSNRM